jgi:hypothetical protein
VSHLVALYLQGEEPWYPLDKRLSEPQRWYGHRLEEKFFASAKDQTSLPVSSQTLYCLSQEVKEALVENYQLHITMVSIELHCGRTWNAAVACNTEAGSQPTHKITLAKYCYLLGFLGNMTSVPLHFLSNATVPVA